MMRELGAETAKVAAVSTGAQTLDDFTRDELEITDFLQHLGIEILRFW